LGRKHITTAVPKAQRVKQPQLTGTVKVSQLHHLRFIATIGWICG